MTLKKEIESIIELEYNTQDKIDQICTLVKERLEKIRLEKTAIKAIVLFVRQHQFLPENHNLELLADLINGVTDTLITELSGESDEKRIY